MQRTTALLQPSRRSVATGLLCAALLGGRLRAAKPERRVLHIDSYHAGNEWNDRIAQAVTTRLQDAGVRVQVFRMDTKRRSSEAQKTAAADAAAELIETWRPHVVTMSDDNAVKYLLMPRYRDAEIPFVFCGLNWDAGVYGLPYANATGMVEVSPIPQIKALLERYADGPRLGFLAEDTPTKRKEMAHHAKLFGIEYARSWFVSDFAAWTDAFREAQGAVDMLMLLGVGALDDWDAEAARRLAREETRIPTGTDFAWLMPYALLGVGKLPEEQGEWAAEAALKILAGTPPSRIPLAHNTRGELLFNPAVARRLGLSDPPALARLVQ
ncbi:MAG: ABC transporter substrate-binding protein [Pseudomonadota bacterium]